VDKNVTMQQAEGNELSAIEGGLGRSLGGNAYGLWHAIKNNGGYVDPSGPPPGINPGQPLDYHSLLTSPDHIE
jgi:hypothetical protein